MAVPMVSFAEGVLFVGFKRLVASFRVAGVALHDIQTCFVTCRKWFCAAGAILSRRFPKMRCIFRGRRKTLDVSIVILRGRRVLCCASHTKEFSTRYKTGWNVTKCHACHAKRHDNLLENLGKGEVVQLPP